MRHEQLEKTRAAILTAATAIAAKGRTPTIVEAAERAGVSRATAYRHFPSQDLLLIEISLPLERLRKALAVAGKADPPRRLGKMVRTIAEWAFDHQVVLREILRVSLSSDLVSRVYRRPTNRMQLVDRELEPLRGSLNAVEFRRLRAAMALLLGIDCIVVLQDVVGLSRTETIDVLEWTAIRLAESTLRGS